MKDKLKAFLFLIIICNIIMSIATTIFSICSNSYFNEYENLKSFNNKKLHMNDDFLLIDKVYQDSGPEGTNMYFDVEGIILSDNSKVVLNVTKLEYLKENVEKQPLYKSKITGDFFLKDAPKEYYNSEIRIFYFKIYLKFSFYLIIGVIMFFVIRHIKYRKYRI
ncbi:hypothetical protein GKZ90_0009850 [Flavobacterium sp. MC2016-06]|uniref:hypothetical protein n=1 Tax=Flavobacterium sp. MC2016-06 TaxID=2676308 RepID=UPI0012BA5BA4|nr:hypothetical protein [Flavobacterium sp. MC2016-06]MBU3859779.1 hypothetical protein [Flavobacterium sp. MC2016-06]